MSFLVNLEDKTIKNANYRKVINTNKHQQLVLMSLEPGEFIPIEKHPHTSQFIRIEQGSGVAEIGRAGETKKKLADGVSITIPPNTWHKITNTSRIHPLKLYSIYSPPEHPPGTIHKRQPVND